VKLERTRSLAELLSDSFALYGAHFGRLMLASVLVIVPVEVVVDGIGLGQLSGAYDATTSQSELLVELVALWLVITPLITSMVIFTLRGSDEPIPAGLEVFAPVVLVAVLTAAAVAGGLVLLVVPGVIAAVRLAFTTPAVVIDGVRGPDALRRSWELTRGSFWRVLGCLFVAGLITSLTGALIAVPFDAVAKGANLEVLQLVGSIVAECLTAPLLAIILTLLYFDLRVRAETPAPA
jgi:Membrane domain of glycerophosphoryl diester phosphodiesterase